MWSLVVSLLAVVPVALAESRKFPFETIQLTSEDIGAFSDIAPGTKAPEAKCRAFPGTSEWPDESTWSRLNVSLGGVLLKPVPAPAVCYPGVYQNEAKCASLLSNQVISKDHFNDPLGLSTNWPAGNPCPAVEKPTGQCTQGGFPVYVVNATSVKHVQIAVNFARSRNIRLVIKNTGHDFVGRSTGAGALSIWTRYLKGFELLPDHVEGQFRGNAAHVGVGLEAWEVHEAMGKYNVTLVAPSFSTVGPFGGFMAAGGHSTLVSYHGLGSDQVLSLNAITANGTFVTASPDTNSDLFFALRGGGPGTYGIVTSAIVKTHPPVNITTTNIAFSSLDTNVATFWKAIEVYFGLGGIIADAGGLDRTYVTPLNNSAVLNFTSSFEFPARSPQSVKDLLQPIVVSLANVGVNVTIPNPETKTWASMVVGEGAAFRERRFASRLIPRAVWDNRESLASAIVAMRKVVEEGGYQVHGTHLGPTLKVAGYPGNTSAANPAFRTAIMHCMVYDFAPAVDIPPAVELADRARLSRYTDFLRNVTAGSGSYMNEADVAEPNWQQSFFGSNYPRLLEIKRRWDPSGLFWAPSTVGSEAWAVRTAGGEPSQNGNLCRAQAG